MTELESPNLIFWQESNIFIALQMGHTSLGLELQEILPLWQCKINLETIIGLNIVDSVFMRLVCEY